MFAIEGEIVSIEPYGNGHINTALLVTTSKKRYIMQIMNTSIFKDSDGLMNNICYVTEYLTSLGIETLEVIPTTDGAKYYKGYEAIRMYKFIEDTVSYQKVTNAKANMILIKGECNTHAYAENCNNTDKYEEFVPDIWKNITDEQKRLGHGGMDYLEFKAFFGAILNNEEMPIDVYDVPHLGCV